MKLQNPNFKLRQTQLLKEHGNGSLTLHGKSDEYPGPQVERRTVYYVRIVASYASSLRRNIAEYERA